MKLGGPFLFAALVGVTSGSLGPLKVAPSVTSISRHHGSSIGGQRLAIEGADFTTNFHEGANTVHVGSQKLGWVECNVVEGACTVDCGSASRIVCDMLEMPASWVAEAENTLVLIPVHHCQRPLPSAFALVELALVLIPVHHCQRPLPMEFALVEITLVRSPVGISANPI
eukprot:COSAG05_NODE_2605_length_2850_cov_3.223192_2_plen_170_part_00